MSAAIAMLVILVAWLLLLGAFARRLHADWREPVLAVPVLIIESDDWGPGPSADAERLRQLADLLRAFPDAHGSFPLITLGVVLAVPGSGAEEQRGDLPRYIRRTLDAAEFAPIRDAMQAGRDAGVFALQLHGMEHFWPPALERAARQDAVARAFLRGVHGVPRHESLPPHLQARWIDAAQLPSAALDRESVERAVAEEMACFARIFGEQPRVAVPLTFTWTTGVESAWARHGIRVVVTPGTRNISRDGNGRLVGDGSILRNGDRAASGVVHVVRDVYFEPALGHSAKRALQDISAHHRLGRPALLEMHRFNFTGDAAQAERSLAELRHLLQGARAAMPGLRFMSTEALADALLARDPALVDRRLAARVRAIVLRASTHSTIRKLAWISGLALLAAAALAVTSALARRRAPAQAQC